MSNFKNSRRAFGFSLVELVVAIGISAIVFLAVGNLGKTITDSFMQAVEENTAEENLLLGAFYLRQFLGQAVETVCQSPAGLLGSPVTLVVPTPNTFPPFLGQGIVDCRTTHSWPVSPVGNPNAFAVFNRENGGSISTAPGNYPISQFVGTGIYFQPPQGSQSGVLYFAQAQPGSRVINVANALTLDHFVDMQITQNPQLSPSGKLESLSVRLTARYVLEENMTPSYLPTPPANVATYKDVSLDLDIALRDNWLGVSSSGSGNSERLYGELYFFRTRMPLLVQ